MKKKPWTRNQKLILAGILVTLFIGIIGFIAKINIEVNYLQDEVDNLKAKNAEIDYLKTEIAEINTIIANQGSFDKITVGECPPGQEAGTIYIQGNAFTQCN